MNHHFFDGWNPTHKNCDEWGMVYGIAIPTLYTKYIDGYDRLVNLEKCEWLL